MNALLRVVTVLLALIIAAGGLTSAAQASAKDTGSDANNTTSGANTAGVRGQNNGTNALGYGVLGQHNGAGVHGQAPGAGTGVNGQALGTSGATRGVRGEARACYELSNRVGRTLCYGTQSVPQRCERR